jgi:hypothetical protein
MLIAMIRCMNNSFTPIYHRLGIINANNMTVVDVNTIAHGKTSGTKRATQVVTSAISLNISTR